MSDRTTLTTLARYHAWATARLIEHSIAPLPDSAYRADRGLFFGSIHATLNHLVVAEQDLWFRRFSEGISPLVQLDAEVEPEREALCRRLDQGARRWGEWLDGLDDATLDGSLCYRTMRGTDAHLPFAPTLLHVFNHATHHRGQISAALTGQGFPGPVLDLVYMLQTES